MSMRLMKRLMAWVVLGLTLDAAAAAVHGGNAFRMLIPRRKSTESCAGNVPGPALYARHEPSSSKRDGLNLHVRRA
jgi:hypothetical protein